MKGTWSFRVIPINQIANFYRHEQKAAGTIKSMKQYCVRIGVNDTTFGGWMNHGYGVMQSSYTQEERESILAAFRKEKEEEGTSMVAYCEKSGISTKTFAAWLQGTGEKLVRIPAVKSVASPSGMIRIEYYGAVITVSACDLPKVLSGIRNA